jgi:hypothetical protein
MQRTNPQTYTGQNRQNEQPKNAFSPETQLYIPYVLYILLCAYCKEMEYLVFDHCILKSSLCSSPSKPKCKSNLKHGLTANLEYEKFYKNESCLYER